MMSRIKLFLKRVLPQGVINTLRPLSNFALIMEQPRTKRIFNAAMDTPAYLDMSALQTLQMRYPSCPDGYGYDEHSLERRGIKRATKILGLPGAQEAHSFLELACWDGMVSCILCRKGKKATAIDKKVRGFDKRASLEGVSLLQMDAAYMQFEDETYDFVFSYNAFEHFASPENILLEAIRVVRKGGYIYLEFGPLYYSPYGEHAERSITVPYCQFLFEKELLNDFAAQNGLNSIDFDHVNGWSLESYRELWSKYSQVLKRVRYNERFDRSHLDLIRAYPSCFKSESKYFENFIVSSIGVLFQKTDHEFPNNGMNADAKS